jgi:hypothetical protein
MLKDYFDFKITITMVCIIILNPLLSTLAHGQQFAFAYQVITVSLLTQEDLAILFVSPSILFSFHFTCYMQFTENVSSQQRNFNNIFRGYRDATEPCLLFRMMFFEEATPIDGINELSSIALGKMSHRT